MSILTQIKLLLIEYEINHSSEVLELLKELVEKLKDDK